MTTIRDVAKLANVSTATVSRVLNNDSKYKMTDETKQRVLEAVSTLNYELPPASVKQSAPVPTDTKIGCILRVTKKKFNDPYFMSILSAVEDRLRDKGYEIAFIRNGAEMNNHAQLLSAFQTPISGLILMDQLEDELYDFVRKQVPHIVGISTNRTDIDNIDYDRFGIARSATEYLIEKGHTKIGFIGGDLKVGQRYHGYLTAMHCANLPINENWVIDCDWDEDICAEKIDKLCELGYYPTAFYVSSDLMAIAALNRFYNNNIKVPDSVAIVSTTDIEIAKYTNPPLTTYRIPAEEIGYAAADLLVARINGYDLSPHKVILTSQLIERGTA